MSETPSESASRWMWSVGWCMIIGAVVIYGGCWLLYKGAIVQGREQAFKAKIEDQQRRYTRTRWSSHVGGEQSAQATQQSIRLLTQRFTPPIIVAGALGILLVALSQRGQFSSHLKNASSMDWRFVLGTVSCVLGTCIFVYGIWTFTAVHSRASTAKRKDSQDLESRTTRNAPSLYRGHVTITHGSTQPRRTQAAEAELKAKLPVAKVSMICGGVILMFGLGLRRYANMQRPKDRRYDNLRDRVRSQSFDGIE